MTATAPAIRAAAEADVPAIHALIRDLAEFEQLAHLCRATEADLRRRAVRRRRPPPRC